MKHIDVRRFALFAMMAAVLLLMGFTPLGYLNVGPLAITFNVIPVAVAAAALGPAGGAAAGAVFGLTSFFQCIGVGGLSMLGSALFAIDPLRTVVLCFVPRILDGFITGWIFRGVGRLLGSGAASFAAGFSAAFLNTAFYMTALLLLFSGTDYMQERIAGQNWLVFIVTFVGINAVSEMVAATAVTGVLGNVLVKARCIPQLRRPKAAQV